MYICKKVFFDILNLYNILLYNNNVHSFLYIIISCSITVILEMELNILILIMKNTKKLFRLWSTNFVVTLHYSNKCYGSLIVNLSLKRQLNKHVLKFLERNTIFYTENQGQTLWNFCYSSFLKPHKENKYLGYIQRNCWKWNCKDMKIKENYS